MAHSHLNRRDWLQLASLATMSLSGFDARRILPGGANASEGVFSRLPFGAVRPEGWLRAQMLQDLDGGFAGRLDRLSTEVSSGIFTTARNSRQAMNLANQDGVPWWNGESEGNWRAGHMMLAGLTGEPDAMARAGDYVAVILASQDPDGYLGAYAPDLRYTREGDLWTQTCLLRGLLAWAELTHSAPVLRAVERAARTTMRALRQAPGAYTWKENHDLMFVDVMESLYEHTGDATYPEFALWLYDTWNAAVPRTDTSLQTLLDPDARWSDHGVHTYEILRVPIWLAATSGRADLARAARQSMHTLARYTLPSGGAVSQEWIEDAAPDPSAARYEYCALKEILVTLTSAYRTSGDPAYGDWIERLFFNAAQGARLPDGTAISYLTRDNRALCGGRDRDGKRREKLSPVHADVAVCCTPNATQIAGHHVRALWMRHPDGGLAAMTHGPSRLRTRVRGTDIEIISHTDYPFERTITFEVRPKTPVRIPLWLRNPGWSGGTVVRCTGARIEERGGFVRVEKNWQPGDRVEISLTPDVRIVPAVNGEVALAHGALLYAEPVASHPVTLREYPGGLRDVEYEAVPLAGAAALPASEQRSGFGFAASTTGTDASAHPFASPPMVLTGEGLAEDGRRVPLSLLPLGSVPTTRRLTRVVR